MLRLVKLEEKYRTQLTEMMEEWTATGEKIVPYAIRKHDYRDFENYLAGMRHHEPSPGHVPASTYFCLDDERNILSVR